MHSLTNKRSIQSFNAVTLFNIAKKIGREIIFFFKIIVILLCLLAFNFYKSVTLRMFIYVFAYYAMSYGLWERSETNQSLEKKHWLLIDLEIEIHHLKIGVNIKANAAVATTISSPTQFNTLRKFIKTFNRKIPLLFKSKKCYRKINYCVNVVRFLIPTHLATLSCFAFFET